jgi:sortase A
MDRRVQDLLRRRNAVPVALIVIGTLVLGYVATQYGQMYWEQKKLAAQFEEDQRSRAMFPDSGSAKDATDDGLIRLVIPKIELTSFVVEGTNHRSLLLGPGHMAKTAEPGDTGNAVITGHRDTFFRHLHELEKGDQIYVDRNGKRLVYQVTGKKIVEPDDVYVTRPTNDSQMTLITCYPTYYIGPAPKRLVVFTKLASEQEAQLTPSDDNKKALTPIRAVGAATSR